MSGPWKIGILVLLTGALVPGTLAAQEAEAGEEGEWTVPPAMTHDLEGRSNCLMCHKTGMMDAQAVPESHTDRTNVTCLWCHAPDAAVQTTAPSSITHDLEGKHACLTCHRAGTMEDTPDVPANHEGRTDEFCTLCHTPAEGGGD